MVTCTKKTIEVRTKLCEESYKRCAEKAAKNGLPMSAWVRGWLEYIIDRNYSYPHKYEIRKPLTKNPTPNNESA